MATIILKFDLDEEREAYENALNGWKYKVALDDIWNTVFRPRHKHGYSEDRINDLLTDPKCHELMDLLEKIYLDTVRED